MKKVMMILTQVLIFTGAYFVMTPDQLVDNTYIFGLIGDVEVIPGNTHWVLIGAALLSIINILVWWPRTQKVTNTQSEKPIIDKTKSEAKDQDPKTPTLD